MKILIFMAVVLIIANVIEHFYLINKKVTIKHFSDTHSYKFLSAKQRLFSLSLEEVEEEKMEILKEKHRIELQLLELYRKIEQQSSPKVIYKKLTVRELESLAVEKILYSMKAPTYLRQMYKNETSFSTLAESRESFLGYMLTKIDAVIEKEDGYYIEII